MTRRLSSYFSPTYRFRPSHGGGGHDFLHGNQVLAQIVWLGYHIAEIAYPTKFFKEASFSNLRPSVLCGVVVPQTAAQCCLGWMKVLAAHLFGKGVGEWQLQRAR
jgi:hypothetical protein